MVVLYYLYLSFDKVPVSVMFWSFPFDLYLELVVLNLFRFFIGWICNPKLLISFK